MVREVGKSVLTGFPPPGFNMIKAMLQGKQATAEDINAALGLLLKIPSSARLGAACSVILECAENEPEKVRRVMNERVIREGFTGISLLELINRTCQ